VKQEGGKGIMKNEMPSPNWRKQGKKGRVQGTMKNEMPSLLPNEKIYL